MLIWVLLLVSMMLVGRCVGILTDVYSRSW
jgi:F0F1-type ATP synthase assembly protein I